MKRLIFTLFTLFTCLPLWANSPMIAVSIIDESTGRGVQGAAVRAYYHHSDSEEPMSNSVTDQKGRTTLPIKNLIAREMGDNSSFLIVEATIDTSEYQAHVGQIPDTQVLETKQKIEIEFRIPSRREEERRRLALKQEQQRATDQAELWFKEQPEYWPAQNKGPYSWVEGEAGRALISLRWNSASIKPLGSKADEVAIREAVLTHMNIPESKISDIRWISKREVMVSSSWYAGPLASAGYTYVLRKLNDQWIVLASYMDYIS